jgi:acyl carrier protein
MTNVEKYQDVFIQSFSVDKTQLDEKFVYESVPEWDSVGHMGMIAELEDSFDIMMEMDDIIDFSSYTVGMDILSKYNIKF